MSKQEARECGDCTACCNGTLNIVVNEETISFDHPCKHLCKTGCGIYNERPEVCRAFTCAWLNKELNLPDWMKPNNAHVIVQQLPHIAVVTAIPTGRNVAPRALKLLKQQADAYRFALTYTEREKLNGKYTGVAITHTYVPPGCQGELDKLRAYLEQSS